jgi:hypothetical protein
MATIMYLYQRIIYEHITACDVITWLWNNIYGLWH